MGKEEKLAQKKITQARRRSLLTQEKVQETVCKSDDIRKLRKGTERLYPRGK